MRIRLFGHYWHPALVLLWLAETTAVVLASRVACRLASGPSSNLRISWTQAGVFGLCVIIAMVAMGLFSRRLRDRMAGVVLRISLSVLTGGVLSALLLSLVPHYRFTIPEFVTVLALAWILLVAVRAVAQGFIDEDVFKRRVLVYGAGGNAMRIARLRRRADQRGFKLLGFISAEDEDRTVPEDRIVKLDKPLYEYARDLEIDEIVVAMDDRRRNFPLKELLECRLAGITISELVTFLERETGKVYLDVLNPSWMIFSGGFRRDGVRVRSERIFDILVSFGLLLITSPFMLLTVLAIKLEDGFNAPVFYGQDRVGFGGRIIRLLKFRSMRVDAESDGIAQWASADDDRVTRVGALIRKVRIDELPQLLNVLKGEMSFVGPRPERPEFVSQFADSIPYYQERHTVKPGITGWAQLCYPYGASEQDAVEKLQYDLFYVKNHDLVFDILILLQTVEVILLGKGAR